MSYVHVTATPDAGLADYRRVRDVLGDDSVIGQQVHWVGENAGMLYTVDVWDSKADADRFAAERLFPAFEKAGFRERGTKIIDFEATKGTQPA